MGILSPINSPIGHGQLGLRSGMRVLSDLYGESVAQKHVFADIYGAKLTSGWAVDSGSVYKITVDETFDGRRLDVVKVFRATETLTRVDARASVVAGTYYYDSTSTVASPLYVQLSDSSNPSSDSVSMCFGFYSGNVSVIHPTLSPDVMVDGDLDVWSSSSVLTNYGASAQNAGNTASSLAQESTIVRSGSFSAKITSTLVPGGIYQYRPSVSLATTSGLVYRWSGYYYCDPNNSGTITPGVRVAGSAVFLSSNGRDTVGTSDPLRLLPLADSRGYWSHFTFDLIAFDTFVIPTFGLHNPSTGATGTGIVYFDKLRFQRVYRYELYEQRFNIRGVPTINEGRKGIHFDAWTIGTGNLQLQNGEAGYLQNLLGQYEFSNQDLTLYLGARCQDGDEVLIEDMRVRRFVQQEAHVTDTNASIPLRTPTTILEQVLPNRTLTVGAFANLATRDIGRTRMLIFGNAPSFIRPSRVDKDGTSTYGKYEGKDPNYMLTGDTAINTGKMALGSDMVSFLNENDANLGSSYGALLYYSGTAYINSSGQILLDVKPIWVRVGVNDMLDFERPAGTPLAAVVASLGYVSGAIYAVGSQTRTGTVAALFAAVQTALSNKSAGSTCTYSDSTHKITISYVGSTLNLDGTSAAPNAVKSGWRTIGYTAAIKYTGALSYTGDNALFQDADSDHILRMPGYVSCYLDDASGTYTGSASVAIEKWGDVLYFLLNKVLNVPTARINLTQLAAMRSGAFSLGVVIGGSSSNTVKLADIVERLENSGLADMVFDGDQWTFVARDNTTPTNILDLWDRDLVAEPDGYYNNDDLKSTVQVAYGYQQEPDRWKTQETTTNAALCRLGRIPSPQQFKTYILQDADATTRLTAFSVNTSNKRRRFKLVIKGVCMGLKPMDKVRINFSNYLGRAGDASNRLLLRILNKTDNWETWESTMECAEVVSASNGY